MTKMQDEGRRLGEETLAELKEGDLQLPPGAEALIANILSGKPISPEDEARIRELQQSIHNGMTENDTHTQQSDQGMTSNGEALHEDPDQVSHEDEEENEPQVIVQKPQPRPSRIKRFFSGARKVFGNFFKQLLG